MNKPIFNNSKTDILKFITFSNGENFLEVPLPEEEIESLEAGYALPRIRMDWLLFNRTCEVVRDNGGSVIQDFMVKEILYDNVNGSHDPGVGSGDNRRIVGIVGIRGGKNGDRFTFKAPFTIGAGGSNCPVARGIVKDTYGESLLNRRHTCGAFRQYWRNVEGFNENSGNIEIHFVDSMVNGYFWIFGVGNGVCNVGCGMLMSDLDNSKKKIKQFQKEVINKHPSFAPRFTNAEFVEGSSKGWQIPFGDPRSRKELESYQPRRAFMNGGVCVGDAASLVDGFSGEGISHAFVSGKMAAEAFDKATHSDGFSLLSGQEYQRLVWEDLGSILSNSYKIQKMVRKKWLLNWFLKKATRKPELQEMLVDALASKSAQTNLNSKWYIIKKLLF